LTKLKLQQDLLM
jgi:hypothetical protein